MVILSMEEIKKYDCSCFKCGIVYQSVDERNTDNYGRCPPCKEKADKIAEQVQKIINQRRAARPPVSPRIEPKTMPGTNYISARDLLL